ncbi:MAG: response regulator [Candidatus Omnitrophica bacterium]|nr:response regulator [Candidatus Omnitrophota bacterium]
MYNLLIIDDEDIIKNMMTRALKSQGRQILMASDAQEALECIESNKLDLIILDLVLPGISGMDLLKSFKAMRLHTPVIVITGLGSEEIIGKVRQIGCEQLLTKPVDIKLLRDIVSGILKGEPRL